MLSLSPPICPQPFLQLGFLLPHPIRRIACRRLPETARVGQRPGRLPPVSAYGHVATRRTAAPRLRPRRPGSRPPLPRLRRHCPQLQFRPLQLTSHVLRRWSWASLRIRPARLCRPPRRLQSLFNFSARQPSGPRASGLPLLVDDLIGPPRRSTPSRPSHLPLPQFPAGSHPFLAAMPAPPPCPPPLSHFPYFLREDRPIHPRASATAMAALSAAAAATGHRRGATQVAISKCRATAPAASSKSRASSRTSPRALE